MLSLWCVLWVTPNHLADLDPRYFMTVHLDDYTEVSFAAMRIRKAGPQPFAVVIFGDSSIRSTALDPRKVEQELSRALGRDVPVHYLAAKGMNLIETAGVMDYIGKDFNGLIIMQMSLYYLAQTPQKLAEVAYLPRLAIHSQVYDQELAAVTGRQPTRTGVYLFDHWKYYAYRLNEHALANVLLGPTPLPLGRNPMTQDQWRTADRNVRSYLAQYPSQRNANTAIVDRMIDRLHRNGQVEVAIVETPTNPRWHRLIDPKLATDHKLYWVRWTQEQNIHYWDLNTEAKFTPKDFHDYVHLSSDPARQRFTELLTKRIVALATLWQTKDNAL